MLGLLILLQVISVAFGTPTFYYYARGSSQPVVLTATSSLQNVAGFNGNERTVFIVHGFTKSYLASGFQEMKNAFNQYTTVNTIIVDWKNEALTDVSAWDLAEFYKDYKAATKNTPIIGSAIAQFIQSNPSYLRPENIVCVGHSLGAHVCGFAGQSVQSALGKKLGRITGLDPAGPVFKDLSELRRLDPTDATYVDAIYTSSILGIRSPIAKANFYPNEGKDQPGCGLFALSCDHNRAIEYYTSSIQDGATCKYLAAQCAVSSYKKVDKCKPCSTLNPTGSAPCIRMGYYADLYPQASGLFYLKTNKRAPFCIN